MWVVWEGWNAGQRRRQSLGREYSRLGEGQVQRLLGGYDWHTEGLEKDRMPGVF